MGCSIGCKIIKRGAIMNGNQQNKAINYSLHFLKAAIEGLRETIKEAKEPLIKTLCEKRLKELEQDYEMFLVLEAE